MTAPFDFGIRQYVMSSGQVIRIGCPSRFFFGDAQHPTTIAAARLVEEHVKRGDTVLDLGTGTATLAIVAAAMGARVTGVDNHPFAMVCGMYNAHINGAEVEFVSADMVEWGKSARTNQYDVVIMNYIMTDIAMAEHVNKLMWDTVFSSVKPNGLVITTEMTSDNPESYAFFPRRFRDNGVIDVYQHDQNWRGVVIQA